MKIIQTQHGDFTVLAMAGELDAVTSPEFESEADKLLEAGARFIVLDLSELTFVSSAGLRCMLALAKQLRAVQGELRFVGLQQSVMEVFTLAGFHRLFPTFSDIAGATAS
jgi:anti-anti-sigma factor